MVPRASEVDAKGTRQTVGVDELGWETLFALTSIPSLLNLQLADAIMLCKKAVLLFWPHFNKAKSGYDGKGLVKRSRKK